MADTIQVVMWSLDYTCPLRNEETLGSPDVAYKSTELARYLGKNHSRGFGLYGDVCVTGYGLAGRPPELPDPHLYPCSGFLVSGKFASIGGKEGLKALCWNCPANKFEEEPAGCAGSFYQDPSSALLEEQLRRIVARLCIEPEVLECFPETKPLWYAFWTASPLSLGAVAVLSKILQEKLKEDFARLSNRKNTTWEEERNAELAAFVRASLRAMESQIPLNVQMSPPGHVDCGVRTVFPHCIFCKAALPNRDTNLQTCKVCATTFSLDELSSSIGTRKDTEFRSRDWDLRELLGKERFPKFAKEYLMTTAGVSENDAIAIVDFTELEEEERLKYWNALQAPEPPKPPEPPKV